MNTFEVDLSSLNTEYVSMSLSFKHKKLPNKVSRGGCVALPRGAMGLSTVCDCGIS